MFGNAELRVPIAEFWLLFPAEVGLLGATDAGRVFYEGDPAGSSTWHASFGGGVWLSFLNRIGAVSATVMSGPDLVGFYLKAGLHF